MATFSRTVNVNWDGSWVVKTQVTETGWTAEFGIPLRTLRYGPAPQVWGMNFLRALESGPRILKVKNCSFERGATENGEMTLDLTVEVLCKT